MRPLRLGVEIVSLCRQTLSNKDATVLEEATYTGLIPIKMSSAIVSFDQFTPGWTLAESDDEVTDQPRRFISKVNFDTPFAGLPLVHIGIAGFDMDQRDSARLSVRADNISTTGFQITLQTWQNSRVYEVEVSWLALGS